MTCSEDLIFIAPNGAPHIFIYTWAGAHVNKVTKKQLGLTSADCIHGIACAEGGHLQIVAEDYYQFSLHVYKVVKFIGHVSPQQI